MTTIRVDFDQDRWLYLPESWPWDGCESLDHSVATVCDLPGPAHQLDAATTTWLGTSLRAIADGDFNLVLPELLPLLAELALSISVVA